MSKGGVDGQGTVNANQGEAPSGQNDHTPLAYIKPFRYGIVFKRDYKDTFGEIPKVPLKGALNKLECLTVEDFDVFDKVTNDGGLFTSKPHKIYSVYSKKTGIPAKYTRLPLRKGWLYVYDGTYMHEYKVLENGKLHKCLHDEKNKGKDVRKPNDFKSDCFVVSKNVTVEVAYSEAQWVWARFSEMTSSATKRSKRMHSFTIGNNIVTNAASDIFASSDIASNFSDYGKPDVSKEWEVKLKKIQSENITSGAVCLDDVIGISKTLNNNVKFHANSEFLFLNDKKNKHALKVMSSINIIRKMYEKKRTPEPNYRPPRVISHGNYEFENPAYNRKSIKEVKKKDPNEPIVHGNPEINLSSSKPKTIDDFIRTDLITQFESVCDNLTKIKKKAAADLDKWNDDNIDKIEIINDDHLIESEKYSNTWTKTFNEIAGGLSYLNENSEFLKKTILHGEGSKKKQSFYTAIDVAKTSSGAIDPVMELAVPFINKFKEDKFKTHWKKFQKACDVQKGMKVKIKKMPVEDILNILTIENIDNIGEVPKGFDSSLLSKDAKISRTVLKEKIPTFKWYSKKADEYILDIRKVAQEDFKKFGSLAGIFAIGNIFDIAPKIKDSQIELFNLLANLTEATSSIVSFVGNNKARNSLKVYKSGKIVKESLETASDIALKFAKIGAKLNMFASIADFTYNIFKAIEFYDTGDDDTFAAHTVAAIGSGMCMYAAFIGLGVALGCAFPPIMGLLAIYAVIFGSTLSIGAAIATVFTENKPLEDWLQFGYWGIRSYESGKKFKHIPNITGYSMVDDEDRMVSNWKDDYDLEYKWFSLILHNYSADIYKKYSSRWGNVIFQMDFDIPSYNKKNSHIEFRVECKIKDKWKELAIKDFNAFHSSSAYGTKEVIRLEYIFAGKVNGVSKEMTETAKALKNADNIRVTTKFYPDNQDKYERNRSGYRKPKKKKFIERVFYEKQPKNYEETILEKILNSGPFRTTELRA